MRVPGRVRYWLKPGLVCVLAGLAGWLLGSWLHANPVAAIVTTVPKELQ